MNQPNENRGGGGQNAPRNIPLDAPPAAGVRRAAMPPPPPPVPLILNQEPLSIGQPGQVPQPGRALVFSTSSGDAVWLPRRPSRMRAGMIYKWRYEVDVAEHYTTLWAEVPSNSDAFFFTLAVDVGWRVSDPARIVRGQTPDGVAIVRSRLLEAINEICRRYDIEECAQAERHINAQLGQGEQTLPEGITVFRFSSRVRLDEATTDWLSRQRAIGRQGVLDSESYKVQKQRQGFDADLENDRLAGLRAAAKGEDDLLLLFLARHPDQVHTVIQDVRQRREMTAQAQLSLFDKFVSEGFIQEADIEPMRRLLLQPIEGFAGARPGEPFGSPQVGPTNTGPPPAALPSGRTGEAGTDGGAGTGGPSGRSGSYASAAPSRADGTSGASGAAGTDRSDGDSGDSASGGSGTGGPNGTAGWTPLSSTGGVVGWTPLRRPTGPDGNGDGPA